MLPPARPTALSDLDEQQIADALETLHRADLVERTAPVALGQAAAWYAGHLRWPVFPLKPRGKQPLTAHGFQDASADLEQVRAWWERWPDANIGLPTGAVDAGGCGYDVLDVDGAQGMQDWSTIRHAECPDGCCDEDVCAAPGPFDIVARACTPGDGVKRGPGRHLYLPATGRGNSARLSGLSIDYRGAGGYVVAPPSVGLSGARYTWLVRPSSEQAAPASPDAPGAA